MVDSAASLNPLLDNNTLTNNISSNGSFNNNQTAMWKDVLGQSDSQILDNGLGPTAVLVLNIIAFVVAFVTALIHIPLLLVIKRIRKLTSAFRILSLNFVTCSLFYFVVVLIMTLRLLVSTETQIKTIDLRVFFSAFIYTLSNFAVCGLNIERYLTVAYPLVASKILTKQNAVYFIVITWIVGLLTSGLIFIVSFISICDPAEVSCNLLPALAKVRIGFSVIYLSFLLLTCVSCYKTLRTVKSIQRVHPDISPSSPQNDDVIINSAPRNTTKQFATSRYILKVIIIYIAAQLPVVLHTVAFLLFPEVKSKLSMNLFKLLSFLCTLASFYVTLHFYIWKSKECRLICLFLFCSWNKKYEQRTRDLKYDVYNIPVGVKMSSSALATLGSSNT